MEKDINYIEINKNSWNNRTEVHLTSEFYDMEGFLGGNSSLNEIELGLLGELRGKTVLHLQCHFGQDSISMSRLGARVTGMDLSDKSIENARLIAKKMGVDTSFICCDLYDLKEHLNRQFDVVFTSYGTITWLPDLGKWAEIISDFLKPGGQFIMAEFHPVVWMFDDDFENIKYNYFKDGPIEESENGTYADPNADLVLDYVTWNHSTSEVLNSLINRGLDIKSFDEYDYSPYNCFRKTVEIAPKKFRIGHLGNKIPMVFSIIAIKKV